MAKKSFDGTNKASVTSSNRVNYAKANAKIKSRKELRAKILASADPESVASLAIDKYIVDIEGNAAQLTAEEWHNRRYGNRALGTLGTIGASSSSHVMGCCPYNSGCTNVDLYHEILGDTPAYEEPVDPGRQHIFDVGHAAEAWLQKKMQELYPGCNVYIDTRIYRDPKRPWMTANLDFMMQLSDGAWVHGEFKTTNPFSAYDAYANNGIPPQYKTQLIQCQHLLNVDESRLICAVMKPTIEKVPSEQLFDPRFDFSKFVDSIITRTYIRDLDDEANQMHAMDDFWFNHVLPEIEPQIVGTAKQVNAAIKKWTGESDTSLPPVDLPDSFADKCQKVYEAQERVNSINKELRDAKAEVERLGMELKQRLGKATEGECDSLVYQNHYYRVNYTPTKGRVSFKGDLLKAANLKEYNDLVDKGYIIPAKKEAGRSFSVDLVERK